MCNTTLEAFIWFQSHYKMHSTHLPYHINCQNSHGSQNLQQYDYWFLTNTCRVLLLLILIMHTTSKLEATINIIATMCFSFLHLWANLTTPSKYFSSFGMVSIFSMGSRDTFPFMKSVNIFNFTATSFSKLMTTYFFHPTSSLVEIELFFNKCVHMYHHIRTLMCKNKS